MAELKNSHGLVGIEKSWRDVEISAANSSNRPIVLVLPACSDEARAFRRRRPAQAAPDRVFRTALAHAQIDTERRGLVRGGNVSRLFLCAVRLRH